LGAAGQGSQNYLGSFGLFSFSVLTQLPRYGLGVRLAIGEKFKGILQILHLSASRFAFFLGKSSGTA
jgi:hypothetical protein